MMKSLSMTPSLSLQEFVSISLSLPTPEVGQVKYIQVLDEISDNKDTILHVIRDLYDRYMVENGHKFVVLVADAKVLGYDLPDHQYEMWVKSYHPEATTLSGQFEDILPLYPIIIIMILSGQFEDVLPLEPVQIDTDDAPMSPVATPQQPCNTPKQPSPEAMPPKHPKLPLPDATPSRRPLKALSANTRGVAATPRSATLQSGRKEVSPVSKYLTTR